MSKGIYYYTDLKDGSIVYIGKDSNIHRNQRHKDHLKPSFYGRQVFNKVLQNNPDRYEYEVLCEADHYSDVYLNCLEKGLIKVFNPKFNMTAGGDSNPMKVPAIAKKHGESRRGENHPLYGTTISEETRKKMSESHKGFKHSEESRKKISEARKGMVFTEEHKKNISLNHADQSGENNGCWGTSVIEDFGGLDFVIDWAKSGKSQTALAKKIGINRATIYDYLKCRGHKWSDFAKRG